MPPPKGYRLCTCHACSQKAVMMDGRSTPGQHLPLSQWAQHQMSRNSSTSSMDFNKHSARGASDDRSKSNLPPVRPIAANNTSTTNLLPSNGSLNMRTLIEETRAELQICQTTVEKALISFVLPHRLVFKTTPSMDPSTPLVGDDLPIPLEDPRLSLKYRVVENDDFIAKEKYMRSVMRSIEDINCREEPGLTAAKEKLKHQVSECLRQMNEYRQREWTRQARQQVLEYRDDNESPILISTDLILKTHNDLRTASATALLAVFLACVLNLICHLSRERSNFVLETLRLIISHLLPANSREQRTLVESIPRDVRQAHDILGLPPHLLRYMNCPKCRSLYPIKSEAEDQLDYQICRYQETKESPECNTPLFKMKNIKGVTHSVPDVIHSYQDFPTWLATFVSRPGMEKLLRSRPGKLPETPPGFIKEIWDGRLVRNFRDRNGDLFFFKETDELRLLFGLGFDYLHPFHAKPAGKKISVGVFFMFCYNLPLDVQLKHENIYIASVVNGPKQPTLTQFNHYARPLIQHLKEFYLRGFFISSTSDSPNGLVSRGAVLTLIMDSHGIRQAVGYGSFITNYFCMYCLLRFEKIDCADPQKWPSWHSYHDHRALAEQWQNAPSESAREALFKEHNIRWSEFLELPYFQLNTMSVIDPMHAFQNVARNLVRETWGINFKKDSGDGLFVGKRPLARKPLTVEECLNVLQAIKNPKAKSKDELENARVAVLFQLCERRQLRRAGDRAQPLRRVLTDHYASHEDHLAEDIELFQSYIKKGITIQRLGVLREIRVRVSSMTSNSRDKDLRWLRKRNINNLRAFCFELKVLYDDADGAAQLVEKILMAQNPIRISSADMDVGPAVLGSDIIKQLDADMKKTVLPSWTATGPKTFNASEHGQLSAAEWRTNILVRLVVTLPRVWSNEDLQDRKNQMLSNFMHLINAMIIASTRTVISAHHPDVLDGKILSTADLFRQEYQSYLEGRVTLYPTAKIQPTEHIVYHEGDKLEEIGPLQNASTNAFERFNGLLQDIPTNRRDGDVETTFIKAFASSANLKSLVDSGDTLDAFMEIKDSFQGTFGIEGGYMLSEIGGTGTRYTYPHFEDLKKKKRKRLNPMMLTLLTTHLNTLYSTTRFTHSATANAKNILIDNTGWILPEAQWQGVWYRQVRPSQVPVKQDEHVVPHRDSYVLLHPRPGAEIAACSIFQIIAHVHCPPESDKQIMQVYIIVQRYRDLDENHMKHDPWRRFPISGGRLFYQELEPESEIYNIKDIVSHYAMTPYGEDEIQGISLACFHALPLTWHRMFSPTIVSGDSDDVDT